jgi:hypothetical protein
MRDFKMKCSNGHSNNDGSVFCETCGQDLSSTKFVKTNSLKFLSKQNKLITVISVILITLFGSWFYFLKPIPIPNLTDLTFSQAQSLITKSDFKVGEQTQVFSDNIALGNIVSQSPSSENSSKRNTKIDLVVSKGPELKDVSFNLTVFGTNYSFISDGTCYGGLTGYWDIRNGTSVTLSDETGNPIGQSSLDASGFGRLCSYKATLFAVPSNKNSYIFDVGTRSPIVYSRDEMKEMDWKISVTLGL